MFSRLFVSVIICVADFVSIIVFSFYIFLYFFTFLFSAGVRFVANGGGGDGVVKCHRKSVSNCEIITLSSDDVTPRILNDSFRSLSCETLADTTDYTIPECCCITATGDDACRYSSPHRGGNDKCNIKLSGNPRLVEEKRRTAEPGGGSSRVLRGSSASPARTSQRQHKPQSSSILKPHPTSSLKPQSSSFKPHPSSSLRQDTSQENVSDAATVTSQVVRKMGRSLKTFGAQMVFRPQVVAGGEDPTAGAPLLQEHEDIVVDTLSQLQV